MGLCIGVAEIVTEPGIYILVRNWEALVSKTNMVDKKKFIAKKI